MTSKQSKYIFKTELDENLYRYLFVMGVLFLTVTIVGIPLMPFMMIFWVWYRNRYNQYHSMLLTEKSLEVRSGVIFRKETTIPLDRITDLTVSQGPLMRWYGIHGITVETAGQTLVSGSGNMPGVIDPYKFRQAVLDQRDKITDEAQSKSKAASENLLMERDLLKDIRDILSRMEKQGKKSG